MKVQTLKFKRNHLFNKLGYEQRQSLDVDSSLVTEVDHSKSVAEKICVLDSNIQSLATATYFWARKPLMTASLILILILGLAGVAYEQGETSNGPRSETSLAIERYLRTRYLGGGTDAQIIAVSDAMAAKFDSADLSAKQRERCFDRRGAPQLILWSLDETPNRTNGTADSPGAVLQDELMDCILPRLVFNEPFSPDRGWYDEIKPLPSTKDASAPSAQGMLASEQLVALRKEISLPTSPERKENPATYSGMVKQFMSVYVLACQYRAEKPGTRSPTYYFWYERIPDGLEQALKTLPPEHPIRQIGPPLSAGPVNIASAIKLSNAAVAASQDRWKDEMEPVIGLPETGIPFLDRMTREATKAEKANRINSRHIAEASGGRKIICPKCGGGKVMAVKGYDSTSVNPYKLNTLAYNGFEQNRKSITIVDCDRCGGTGVIDK